MFDFLSKLRRTRKIVCFQSLRRELEEKSAQLRLTTNIHNSGLDYFPYVKILVIYLAVSSLPTFYYSSPLVLLRHYFLSYMLRKAFLDIFR